MTTPTPPKVTPVPAILVYGTPSSPALTQASWFRAEDKEAVKAAAETLKFSVIELLTDADRALAASAHEGVLKGSGRMIVGSVSAEVYRRIEEHVRKAAGAPDASQPDSAAAATMKPASEQTHEHGASDPRTSSVPTRPPRRAPGTSLGRPCGSARGSWPPIGTRSRSSRASGSRPSSGSSTASSPWSGSTAPEYPPFKSRPQNIAVPHPEFRVSGK